jgi:NAD(P)H-dependent FMN reductase
MKNALDWVVGCEAFVDKPVAVLNASPRAKYADAALRETLSVMSARIVEDASVSIPILGSQLDSHWRIQSFLSLEHRSGRDDWLDHATVQMA